MAAMTPTGGEGGGDLPRLGADSSTGGVDGSGAYSTSEDYMNDDDFAELALSTEQRLRLEHIWVANPSTVHQWTHGIGSVSLYDDVLEVRIYFDAAEMLELKLCSPDVTYLNIVAVMETQGFSVYDLLYHIENPVLGEEGLEMVETNAELQLIKRQIKESKVLNLLVRACPPHVSQFKSQELSTLEYEELVSKNVKGKLEAVLELEEEEGYEGTDGSDCEEEEETDDEESEEEEEVHYECDIEVEELSQMDEDDKVVSHDEDTVFLHEEKKKKKQKLPVRRGPRTRSHSSVLEKEEPEIKPSSDEEEKGLLKEADDDGFEPLSFVRPKKRKSRAK
ncbi:hypothetical protein D1007_00003 [Hordeum vulgare]|nr:hypothetical protein D1007_00003 [Hordeum vulgare]